jgi:molecular chaperone GrpE
MSEHETKNPDMLETAREEKLAEQDILKEALEEKNKQIVSYHDQLLRLKAEFENYRKRVDREKMEHHAWGKEEILLKLIFLADVLTQAFQQAKTSKNIESVITGLDLINKEFDKFLTSEGLQIIETEKKQFDPHLHEAVEYSEDSAKNDGDIIQELQKGYCFNGRIVRPAKVKVAKQKAVIEETIEPKSIN